MKIIAFISAVKEFLFKEIWVISHQGISPVKSFLIKEVKIFLVTFRGFMENKVVLRASALTYYSLMSVVPVAAMAFGVAKGFGIDKILQRELANKLNGQEEVLNWIIKFANTLLERTKGGIVAGVGLVLLFWSVMGVLGNIEESFNNIWQIKKGRKLFRRFADYIAIMLIAPIFIVLSSSVTVYITTHIGSILKSIAFLGYFSPLIRIFINLIPYVLVWMLFSFIYIVMPNTRVKFWPAIISGIVAGTIFQISQWAYVKFQIYVTSYNAIYGSFAALPLFLLWVQMAWLIVLFGAEMSYATQNYEKYEFENEANLISRGYRNALSLLITGYIVKKFVKMEEPPGIDKISTELHIPSRIVREITNILLEAGILSQVISSNNSDILYQPALDINQLTISLLFEKVDRSGINSLPIANVSEMAKINSFLSGLKNTLDKSEHNVLLKDI